MNKRFLVKVVGEQEPAGSRIFFEEEGRRISPWHDIPLYVDQGKGVLNMVVEIPKGTSAKLEISKEEDYNPIKQDTSHGKPRYLADIPPFQGYPCNYGAFPQTYESPDIVDDKTGIQGDDDPLDVCEIGNEPAYPGEVKTVKVLGAIAILDQGQTDWKIIAVDTYDPLASKLSDISDMETHLPGFLGKLKDWYCLYKIPEGKPQNEVALGGQLQDRRTALGLIDHFHGTWKSMQKRPGK
ncbi:hypothetical protein CNBE0110 [Paecilomyces variotii No. 5]|uniref:inorganic diphosphatase n=1 Tax=Byssochlamys spectabilis (strain No. 5 / NBRC 109023) TaxID=1356009 RepID=V5HW75_BYSSN|nr:hypothetical protein CNBE0110 [Paecilomyces variotii No. 5]